MPGIFGILATGKEQNYGSDLFAMLTCMLHEPFCSNGTYLNGDMGIWTGWVCHDRAFSDGMPVWNEAKDICIIFSGENVIDVEEVTQLKSKGHKPGTQAASCLVHLYEEDGEGFLQKLNGWFSGVCIDLRQRTVFVFNDRYGLNHMYYHEKNGVFYFASEAKCLLKILPELRHLHLPSFA